MDIMISSFGLAQAMYWKSKGKNFPLQNSLFHGIPPCIPNDLVIDVTPFILYDKIIIDKTWLEPKDNRLKEKIFSASILNSETAIELTRKGIIEPRDYASDTNNHLFLLEKMTDYDLANLDWTKVIKRSFSAWREYVRRTEITLFHAATEQTGIDWMRESHATFMSFSDDLERESVQDYLLNVNNMLLLSRNYSSGIFD